MANYIPNSMALRPASPAEPPASGVRFGDRSPTAASAPQRPIEQRPAPTGQMVGYAQQRQHQHQQPKQRPADIGRKMMDPHSIHQNEHTAVRRIVVTLKFSAAQAHSSPQAACTVVDNPHAIKYRPGDSDYGAERIGDTSHALLFDVRLLQMRNQHNFDVIVGSKTLAGGNLYCAGGQQRGFALVMGGGNTVSYGRKGKRIYFPTRNLYSSVVHQYGELSHKHLEAQSVQNTNEAGETIVYRVVPIGTALALCIESNSAKHGFTIGAGGGCDVIRMPTGHLWTPDNIYQKARNALEKKVIQRQPYVNLGKLDFYCFRPNSPWLNKDGLSLLAGSNVALCERELKSTGTVTLELELKYRLRGHGRIGSAAQ